MKQQAVKPMLGIIAGEGRLPEQLVEACRANGRPVFVLSFDDINPGSILSTVPHAVVRIGAVGEALQKLRDAGVQQIAMAGKVRRPSITNLKPDASGLKLLGKLGTTFLSGDDSIFRKVVEFLESEGFSIIGSDDVFSDLLADHGSMSKRVPDEQDQRDILLGIKVARTLGALDVGQAVVVENGHVLGIEAAEGTDGLVDRCRLLKKQIQGGVLVKMAKPLQDRRVDLPAIGPDTVRNAHAAGLNGIAVESSGSLILDKEKTIALADELGIFISGVLND